MTTPLCVLKECATPAEFFTLCDLHQESLRIRVLRPGMHGRYNAMMRRRKQQQHKQRPLPTADCRVGVHATDTEITAEMIAHIRHALHRRPTRQVAAAIGISHFTIYRLADATPGQIINRKTYDKIRAWMETQ